MHTNYERKVSLKDVASETPSNSPSFGHSPIMLLTPFVSEICLSICWPSGHDTVVLFQAGSSLKLCRNKTASTFMARPDLVLRTELCRLSNRHCGKKKKKKNASRQSSAFHFICSVTERMQTVNCARRGRSSLHVQNCITERKMRNLKVKINSNLGQLKGQVWLTRWTWNETARVSPNIRWLECDRQDLKVMTVTQWPEWNRVWFSMRLSFSIRRRRCFFVL